MEFIKNIFRSIGSFFGWLFAFIRRLSWPKRIGLLAVVVLLGFILSNAFGGKSDETVTQNQIRAVEVRSVAELSSESTPLSITGTVSSKSEAEVRAESSGRIVSVLRNLGDIVSAGSIVAEIENSAQRAALLQAQGSQAAARANLEKVKKGARTEDLSNLESALRAAKESALNTLLSAYATVNSSIRGTTDPLFSNPTSNYSRYNLTTNNSALDSEVNSKRLVMQTILNREKARSGTLTVSEDLYAELTATEKEIRSVRDFLDAIIAILNVSVATNDYPQATIATYIASASAARASIDGTLSALSAARQGLQTAENNMTKATTGAEPEDIAAAEASVTQMDGVVASARATLEKTLIRAPISGTINSFSLKVGDYVNQGSTVLNVANNGALEVVAYVTEGDTKEIAVGQSVTFDKGAVGTVTRMASALDPITKKIEVRIGVTDPNKTLLNGQSVLVNIARVNPKLVASSRITIPISAIKVETETVSVFTVNEDGSLSSHEVTLGSLLGDRVEITGGLSVDMSIVTDARGLRAGQKVEVK